MAVVVQLDWVRAKAIFQIVQVDVAPVVSIACGEDIVCGSQQLTVFAVD
jgi:hypothetical protein